ncbi:MAG: CBS domain-containing protein [Deltaproteobacteria bacterium]|nr:CBS domain-containing protein [Deltaproteobacteria bacterium]
MVTLLAKDIMNTDVLSVGPDWSIGQLADFLCTNSISGAPVISEDNRLMGVVSMTDLVRQTSMPGVNSCNDFIEAPYIHASERHYSPEEIESSRIDAPSLVTVRDIMTPVTFNVTEYTRIQDVADAMLRGKIHRVFVTRNESLIGIITTMDLLSAVRDL